jgi:hypothetical protein
MASEQDGDEEEDEKAWPRHCEQKELLLQCGSGLKVNTKVKAGIRGKHWTVDLLGSPCKTRLDTEVNTNLSYKSLNYCCDCL